jgi:hypothetical protein
MDNNSHKGGIFGVFRLQAHQFADVVVSMGGDKRKALMSLAIVANAFSWESKGRYCRPKYALHPPDASAATGGGVSLNRHGVLKILARRALGATRQK